MKTIQRDGYVLSQSGYSIFLKGSVAIENLPVFRSQVWTLVRRSLNKKEWSHFEKGPEDSAYREFCVLSMKMFGKEYNIDLEESGVSLANYHGGQLVIYLEHPSGDIELPYCYRGVYIKK